MNGKIVFIVSALSQPRCIKRITAIAKAGFDCSVYGYDRGMYRCNAYPDNIKVHTLGSLPSGSGYWAKLLMYKKDIDRIVRENGRDNVLYYGFGMLASIGLYLKKVKYAQEISDIAYAYPSFKRIEPLLRKFDKIIIKRSQLTVMTSEGFKQYYDLNDSNIIVQPNKVNASLINVERKPLPPSCAEHLVFAYVGAIRYDTIFRFAETIGKYYPQHEYHFYGESRRDIMQEVDRLVSTYTNVKKYGAFKNPDDLPSIYNEIDVVTACYQVSSLNERIAEPNKLYEAIFFCKPIVVSDGIFLSEQVKKYGCGFCMDASTEENIRNFVDSLNGKELSDISHREYSMDTSVSIDNEETIINRIKTIFKR